MSQVVTFVVCYARSVAASSSARTQGPLVWNRKTADGGGDWYDVEAGGSEGAENERTPLLLLSGRGRNAQLSERHPVSKQRRNQEPNKVHPVALLLMLALLAILMLGIVIGAYLLVLQIDRPWPVSHPFFLVERPAWWYHSKELQTAALDRAAIKDVIVLHTHTGSCFGEQECLRFLQQTEDRSWAERNDHIPYNFLIGGDGNTYEARGWKYQHGFHDLPGKNSTLVVGMIGDFSQRHPTDMQYAELKAFLTESIRRLSLSPHYKLRGIVNGTQPTEDATTLYHQLQRWPHWGGLVPV
uniref:Peptidoglycan recognition protein family domain-containing protein n=1 Tax=Anopheles darlingi TaxID=43151 RepID=A0A087YSZ4_ANODA